MNQIKPTLKKHKHKSQWYLTYSGYKQIFTGDWNWFKRSIDVNSFQNGIDKLVELDRKTKIKIVRT